MLGVPTVCDHDGSWWKNHHGRIFIQLKLRLCKYTSLIYLIMSTLLIGVGTAYMR